MTNTDKKVSFEEFFKEFMKDGDYDVWNMSLETYNFYKKMAKEIYQQTYTV